MLRTDPVVHGNIETFRVDATTVAWVMVGNPVVEGDDVTVKADSLVVWLDSTQMDEGFGLSNPAGAATPAVGTAGSTGGGAPTAAPPSSGSSVLPEALIAIYAVGAVDLVSGDISFLASELYLNARTHRALLIEPRFETSTPIGTAAKIVPVHVRAQTLRALTDGFAVFEKADLATSRSNDRIGLQMAILTVEEFGHVEAQKSILGFRTVGSQRFHGRAIVGRGERLPLLYVHDASFGGEHGLADFPIRLRDVTTGSRSSLGRYGFVSLGARHELDPDTYVDWTAIVGGYTERGFAAGGAVEWKELAAKRVDPPRSEGRLDVYGVADNSGEDRDGYLAGEGLRWKAELENRFQWTKSLRVDTEINAFSDRGFNQEYFDADDRNHKDRETYARLRWLEGGVGAALTTGLHTRNWKTETLEEPSLLLASESLPLGQTSGPIRLAFDLSSAASIARLARRFDVALEGRENDDYEALRADVTERLYAPFDVGDVRVSPFVGVRCTKYSDRTDGGADLTRTAFEAGVRANIQLHRDFALVGGPWRLDGLRHVVDLDVGAYRRSSNEVSLADVPFFDRVDLEEDRSEVFIEVRNRLEARQVVGADHRNERGGERLNATLADLRLKASFWPESVGPYGRRGPGQIEMWGMAEIIPDAAWLRGESVVALQGATFRHSSVAVHWSPFDATSAAVGVRHIQDEVLAPWFEVYRRWNEKWGARVSGTRDFDSGVRGSIRLSLLRFSDDHLFEFSASLRDDGRDVGFSVNFHPAIGGEALTSPFDPRDSIDFTP